MITPNPRTRVSRGRTFDALLRFRDYRFLWTASFCANSAQWVQILSVGWLVRALTESSGFSGFLVVTVGGLSTLPVLVVGPWGGVLGDRVNRRKLVIGIQSFMGVTAVLFSLLVFSGRVEWWHAYLYVLLNGICRSVNQPLRQALIANTVPREVLINAYATNVLTITGTRIIGPFLGGVLIATLGFAWNFALEGIFYFCAVLCLIPMKTPYYQVVSSAITHSPLADLKEGIRYIWRQERVILNLMVLGLIPNIVLHPVWFILPVFTAEVLHQNADVGGYLLAITGVGGLVAALVIASKGFVFRRGIVLFGAVAMSAISVILFSQFPWLSAALLLIGLMAFAQTMYRTAAGAVIQLLVPDTLRSRVTSLQSYSQGFLILSSLLVGWYVDLTTVSTAILTLGVAALVLLGLSSVIFKRVRQLT
ncbi:MAG: MFS transporter [Chloroflexi bacterium]|nr:MFS transporter [Chloroflexota bacterium]